VFSKNRVRLLEGDIAAKFLGAIHSQPKVKRLLSTDHFSVDGTLNEAWASMKSFKRKDGSHEPPSDGGGRNAEADFHGERRSTETHASTTDSDAKLYRTGKGKEAKLSFMGHGLMENRHGLLVNAYLTEATGYAERIANARHAIPAMRSAYAFASVSRRPSAGSKRSRGRTRRSSGVATALDGHLPSRPPAILCGYRSS